MKKPIWLIVRPGILFSALSLLLMPHLSKAFDLFDSTVKDAPHEVKRLHAQGNLLAVAWNADGTLIAGLGSFGSHVSLWDAESGKLLNEFDRYGGAYSFNSLAFLPDGSLLTSAPMGDYSQDPRYANTPLTDPKYNTLEIFSLIQWNPETGKTVRYIPDLGYPPKDLSGKRTDTFTVSKDGSTIAGIFWDRIFLYEAKEGALLRTLTVPHDPNQKVFLSALAFSPDGQELAVSDISGKLYFFGTNDGELKRFFQIYPLDDEIHFKAKSGNGDLEDRVIKTNDYSATSLTYSPDGLLIATSKYKKFDVKTPTTSSVDIWQVSDGKIIASLTDSTSKNQNNQDEAVTPRTLAWSPVANILAIGDDVCLRIWEITGTAQKQLLKKPISHGVCCVSFSSNGKLAALDNNEVIIYQQH